MTTVLTVDDSVAMRAVLLLTLRHAGYDVIQAEDGIHGLQMLEDSAPDVIITDINMPRMDGFGFIEGVRDITRHRRTPILVLTSETDVAKRDKGRSAGAAGWLTKPFDVDGLLTAIRRVAH